MIDKKTDDAGMTRREFNKARRNANKVIKKTVGGGSKYREEKLRRSDFGDISINTNTKAEDKKTTFNDNQEFGKGGKMQNNRYGNGGIIQHD